MLVESDNAVKKIILLFYLISVLCFTSCSLLDKKTKTKEWKIDNYKIQLYAGRGVVGPPYYFYKLKKRQFGKNIFFKSKKTYTSLERIRDCEITFKNTSRSLDICSNLPIPIKENLNKNLVSNIEVIRIDSMSIKRIILDSSQKMTFINGWNKVTKYSSGSPRIKYLIKIGHRTFNSDGTYTN